MTIRSSARSRLHYLRHERAFWPRPAPTRQTAGMTVLEFWPEYGSGPLWANDGKPVDLTSLGMSEELAAEVQAWNARYAEDKVPIESTGDAAWLGQGKGLLEQIRDALGDQYQVVVTEPWWGEDPT
jgi:hypothetical protein